MKERKYEDEKEKIKEKKTIKRKKERVLTKEI